MTRRLPAALVLGLALLAAACSPRRIPGTEIRETRDTRAVFDAVEAYRNAMQKRDAPSVLALVAPDYFDTSGTPEPDDDVDLGLLEKRLPEDLAKVDAMRLELTVRRIAVTDDRAQAEIFFDAWYRVKTPGGSVVPRRDSDVHRMQLRRVEGAWKFTSGL
jgi:hypothetical protein